LNISRAFAAGGLFNLKQTGIKIVVVIIIWP
jgi:hypothetical protein